MGIMSLLEDTLEVVILCFFSKDNPKWFLIIVLIFAVGIGIKSCSDPEDKSTGSVKAPQFPRETP